MTRPARWRPALLVVALAAVLVVLCLLSLGLGALSIPPGDVIKALTGQPTGPVSRTSSGPCASRVRSWASPPEPPSASPAA